MILILAIVTAGNAAELLILMQMTGKKPCSLYIHIPFCTKKCAYCHFFVLPNHPQDQERLKTGLKQEWELRAPQLEGFTIESIYFGGGTPALMSPQNLAEILSWINVPSTIEITLEANPDDLSYTLLNEFKQIGINRLSIGVQTFDDQLLKVLGRTHDSKTTLQAIEWSHQVGFNNVSIDLMYDIPHQTLDSWQHTLYIATKQPITHLSLYNLTIEPKTLFFKQQQTLKTHLPSPETSLLMYQLAQEKLSDAELSAYEISAFSKRGYHSQHNMGYWTARPFFGFGPSAYSFWNHIRFRNIPHLNKYLTALATKSEPVDLYDTLSTEDRRKELLVVEMRLTEGVHLPTFEAKHGPLDKSTDHTLIELQKKGWLEKKEQQLMLTQQGILFYDSVAAELI